MRVLWLTLLAPALLTACGDKAETNNSAAIDQVLADDPLTGNDLTAIDAVSGSDANMADDVDFNATANDANGTAPTNSSASAKKRPPASKPAPKPAAPDAASDADTSSETTNAA